MVCSTTEVTFSYSLVLARSLRLASVLRSLVVFCSLAVLTAFGWEHFPLTIHLDAFSTALARSVGYRSRPLCSSFANVVCI